MQVLPGAASSVPMTVDEIASFVALARGRLGDRSDRRRGRLHI